VTGRRAGAFLAAAAGIALLEISRGINGEPLTALGVLGPAAFAAAVLFLASGARPATDADGSWRVPPAALLVAAGGAAAAAIALSTSSEAAALLATAALWSATLAAGVGGAANRRFATGAKGLLLSAAAGALPMIAVEIESEFAHEELFVAAQALLLALSWICLRASLGRARPGTFASGVRVDARALGLAASLAGLAVLGVAVARYQASFSDPNPPGFPGVSEEAPFLCGRVAPDAETFDGRDVLARLLARVAADPRRGAPEEGMLALSSGDLARARAFRSALLAEVAQELFSRRGDTKYWQFEASLRAYYYPRVRDAFPGLFSREEERRVGAWFAGIDRHALSPGLDDAIYALAFRKTPEGPYENQENGAGLLALLDAGRLAAPELAAKNRAYLDRAPRGWEARFRNNDDSYGYQPEWIDNAYYRSLRSGSAPEQTARRSLSFEWLLLQAEPGGRPPDYNAAVPPALPGAAYLGAILTRDPALLWLAGRSVRAFERSGQTLPAQPGVERPLDAIGVSPTAGSCLIYADSGLPNRRGPLAPDKIVLRDGWSETSRYLLWNLRFSGWHRYRATNAIVRVVADGATLAEERGGQPNAYLPLERRLFRDKRIPRENLNGLLVAPTGFAAALARLCGFGGPWAQDPPHFARVESFEAPDGGDASAAARTTWRGWTHRRRALLVSGGPIVVVDDAEGPRGRRAALTWHLDGTPAADRYRLAGGDGELVLLSLGGRALVEIASGPPQRVDLVCRPAAADGRLRIASVFLTGPWRGAGVRIRGAGRDRAIEITRGGARRLVAVAPLP
jgi:hypothetical protein